MVGKMRGIVTSEVLDRAALHAFSVEMVAAIALHANVLVNVAIARSAMEFLDHIRCAKLGKMTVNAAFSRLRVAVDRNTDLFRCKLTVGILRKELSDPLTSQRPIRLFLHLFHLPHFNRFSQN